MVEGRNLLAMDSNGKSDPFCFVYFNKDVKTKKVTTIQMETLNPKWDQSFSFICYEPQTDKIKIEGTYYKNILIDQPIYSTVA